MLLNSFISQIYFILSHIHSSLRVGSLVPRIVCNKFIKEKFIFIFIIIILFIILIVKNFKRPVSIFLKVILKFFRNKDISYFLIFLRDLIWIQYYLIRKLLKSFAWKNFIEILFLEIIIRLKSNRTIQSSWILLEFAQNIFRFKHIWYFFWNFILFCLILRRFLKLIMAHLRVGNFELWKSFTHFIIKLNFSSFEHFWINFFFIFLFILTLLIFIHKC